MDLLVSRDPKTYNPFFRKPIELMIPSGVADNIESLVNANLYPEVSFNFLIEINLNGSAGM